METESVLTANELLVHLSSLPASDGAAKPAETIEDSPRSNALAIGEGALSGMSEQEILAPLGSGGDAFDLTPILAALAALATLFCRVIEIVKVLRERKTAPTPDEVIAELPKEHANKPEARVVVVYVLALPVLPVLPPQFKGRRPH